MRAVFVRLVGNAAFLSALTFAWSSEAAIDVNDYMVTKAEHVRLVLFVGSIVLVYYLALRWCLARRRARSAAPMSRFDRVFQSRITGAILLGLAGMGLLCFADGFLWEPKRLTVTSYRIETAKIPRGEHVRIVQLADLHVRENGPRERALPDFVRALNPDLILHTGDFFGKRDGVEPILAGILRSWTTPQFACDGNLDYLGNLDQALHEGGVTILRGTSSVVQVRGARVRIMGIPSGADDAMPKVLGNLPSDTYNILLCHHPHCFPGTWSTPTDLMLAGHIHGGQVRLPWYGALLTLDRYGKRWEYGLYEEHGVKLIVSRGIGCEPYAPEVRFLCPPEVVAIDLVGTGKS